MVGRAATFVAAFVTAAAFGSEATAEAIRVTIDDLAFSPAAVAAKVGDTIEWTNRDFVDHTATAADGSWDVTIPVNETRTLELKSAGAADYFCRFHPTMRGRADVAAP